MISIFRHSASLLLLVTILQSCCNCANKINLIEKQPALVFTVAGHTYGSPENFTGSIYPPFLNRFRQDKKSSILFLTGDVVAKPTPENWETVKSELDGLDIPWYLARGNHDISPYLDEKIQAKKYLSFKSHTNLFLVLNTSFPGWSVDSVQAKFIETELTVAKNYTNIFVFTHQLWWIKDTPAIYELDAVRPNSFADYDGETSFWQTAFPFFSELDNPVYFFAGDMGSDKILESYYEDHHQNFHFYGSGMGGGIADNYLRVSVYEYGGVKIERIDF